MQWRCINIYVWGGIMCSFEPLEVELEAEEAGEGVDGKGVLHHVHGWELEHGNRMLMQRCHAC